MIAIVNYGLGNVHAIANIYKRLNIPTLIATNAQELMSADRLILPGVGAFDWALSRLHESGMRDALDRAVIDDCKPVLGICVGMQMMAKRSQEGTAPGLGWVDAEVHKFDQSMGGARISLPHMGWNTVRPIEGGGIFRELDESARFYFLHSYFFAPNNVANILAETDYHITYASAVKARGNIYGVQFHPEKSHQWGIQLLNNFASL